MDRRLGRPSPHRVPVDETEKVLQLYEERYRAWPVKHFHERLVERHGIARSYSWTKSVLHAPGHGPAGKKRSTHRKKRPHRPAAGMMLQPGRSRHEWVPEQIGVFGS